MILIVEDHRDTRECLSLFLESEGFEVRSVASGIAAIDLMSDLNPTLVILDNHMPEITGEEVLATMRSSETMNSIPVIFFSADNASDTVKRALDLGAHAYISKGGDWDQLLAAARQFETKRPIQSH